MRQSLGQLASHYKAEGKEKLFEELRMFLTGSADPLPAYFDWPPTGNAGVDSAQSLLPGCGRVIGSVARRGATHGGNGGGSRWRAARIVARADDSISRNRRWNPPAAIAVCSTCGEPLERRRVRRLFAAGGLNDQSKNRAGGRLLVFGDFEIALREDGSLWKWGRGAMGVTYRAMDKVLHRTWR